MNLLSKIVEWLVPASATVGLLFYFERKKNYKVLDTIEVILDKAVKCFEELHLDKVGYDKHDNSSPKQNQSIKSEFQK